MATNLVRQSWEEDRTTGHAQARTFTTIEGHAMQVRGDPVRYRDLGLIETAAPTLLWVPKTYNQGDRPRPGDRLTWGGLDYTVRDVREVAPDGELILAKIIIER